MRRRAVESVVRRCRHGRSIHLSRALATFATAFVLAGLYPRAARSADLDSTEAVSSLPTIFLDLNTVYSSVPANVLPMGFGNFGSLLTSKLDSLKAQSGLPNAPLSLPASQDFTFNAPLTVNPTDWLSVYGGVSGSTSRTDSSSWGRLTLSTWNIGFSADVIQQHEWVPTVTLQASLTNPIGSNPLGLSTTTLATNLEFNYALNEDQTEGLLAGVQYTNVSVNSSLAILDPTVKPAIIGYAGGYYQWPGNWKLSGRFGIQTFGGAQIGTLIRAASFTEPVVRIDLDRNDDSDNRLFGLSAEVAWTPHPLVQLILRTPLYAFRKVEAD